MVQTRDLLRSERHHDPARVMALADGVIAIVITLLVLEIHVPELPAGPGPEGVKRVPDRAGRRRGLGRSEAARGTPRAEGRQA